MRYYPQSKMVNCDHFAGLIPVSSIENHSADLPLSMDLNLDSQL